MFKETAVEESEEVKCLYFARIPLLNLAFPENTTILTLEHSLLPNTEDWPTYVEQVLSIYCPYDAKINLGKRRVLFVIFTRARIFPTHIDAGLRSEVIFGD